MLFSFLFPPKAKKHLVHFAYRKPLIQGLAKQVDLILRKSMIAVMINWFSSSVVILSCF